MIRLRIKDKSYIYDVFHIVKAFFPNETVEQEIDEEQGMFLELEVCVQERICRICAEIKELDAYETKKEKKQYLDRKIYRALAEYSGKTLAWGILTGIRPTKIAMKMLEEQMEKEEIQRTLMEQYLMSEEKARLGIEIAKREKAQLEQLDYEDGYSLYVGIPFCPTTCAYCSFTSYPIEAWKTRVEEYLGALCKEISYVGDISKEKKLNTIYIGGGTPTTLEADQLDRLLTHLEETFSYEEIKEITVEAGRPDSITREKLEVLKRHKIPRISINPQTMQQKTLDLIGRRHTVEDILRVYGMARELEFENINMDLIAGLPGETVQITNGRILIDGETYKEGKDFPKISNAGLASKAISLGTGEYFVLGDNRNNSEDSRYTDIGLVKKRYIAGKIWFTCAPARKLGFWKG